MSTPDSRRHITRRHFLKVAGASTASLALLPGSLWPAEKEAIFRVVPSTKTTLPVIGMGSWLTFDVHMRSPMVGKRVEVLRTFFNRGGALIDSSPMYGLSEEVIGHGLKQLPGDGALFSATKVWSRGQQRGIRQMDKSLELWGIEKFDLMQIHNMVDWEDQLETLRAWKADNRIGHIGITTSHGRRHDKVEDQNASHTQNELEEVFFTDWFDREKFIAGGLEMLEGVAAFWSGLDADRKRVQAA